MTKQEFTTKLTEKVNGLTKKDAAFMIDTIGEVVAETLVAGGDVTLPGVGKFVVKDTNARTARNPQTGEAMEVPASKKVAFKVTAPLKVAVKETVK